MNSTSTDADSFLLERRSLHRAWRLLTDRQPSKPIRMIREKLNAVFSLDIRSLALFRIGLGGCLLFDLAIRATSLKAFYTDSGLLPRSLWLNENANPWIWSFHLMGGTTFSQTLLFLAAALFAVGLLVGYRTRLMTLLSWLLLTSLHNRLPMVQNSADVYMRLSLLWSIFLPLGACWSIDRALISSKEEIPQQIAGWGSFALLMQTCVLYWMTSAYKFRGHDWWGTGSAVYYVLNLDVFATRTAHVLLMFPAFLTYLTYAIMFYETTGPFLLLSPVRTARTRTLGLLGFFLLHLSFGLCLRVDPFPRISLLELLPLIPGEVWNSVSPFFHRLRLDMQFDGYRRLRDLGRRMLSGLNRRPISLNQGWWCKEMLAGFLFAIGVYWTVLNFHSPLFPLPAMTPTINAICDILHLDQAWGMFAPEIARRSGWWVIPGKLQNGQIVDIYKEGAPLSWAPPRLASSEFKSERWRRFSAQLMGGSREGFVEYSQYLCRSWNSSHSGGEELQSFGIILMASEALPNYQRIVPHAVPMWFGNCVAPEPNHEQDVIHVPTFRNPKNHARSPRLIMQVPFAPN